MAYTYKTGRKTVASLGTAEALDTGACLEVIITAETDNTGIVTVGGSDVVGAVATRKGVPLASSESLTLKADNLDEIFLDVTVNGEGVTYLAVQKG